jgi:hypothetical protein
MRKFRIDDVKAIASDYKTQLDKHKDEILDAIDDLKSKFDGTHTIKNRRGGILTPIETKAYQDYVDKFRTDYYNDRFVLMFPNEFENVYKNEYLNVLQDKQLRQKLCIDGDKIASLSDRLVKVMGYSEIVRREIFPTIMRQLGIKACVYCNSNYVVAGEERGTYFELDHWKPTSKYPFLSTSFYNLQPCCPHCNKRKNADNKNCEYLKLYEEDSKESLDVFQFHIPESAVVLYFSAQDTSYMKVEFKAANPQYNELRNSTNEKFNIEGIYNQHIDVVEEMMWRAKFYNYSIIRSMTWLYGERYPLVDISRFKLGTYANSDEIHKRPLTKFMQDIGRQLGII